VVVQRRAQILDLALDFAFVLYFPRGHLL